MTTRMTRFWDEIVEAVDSDVMSIGEVSDMTGKSDNAVRSAFERRGVVLTSTDAQSLRTKAAKMEPGEAVEYLLDVCEMISFVNLEQEHPTDFLKVSPLERRMLRCLYDAGGLNVPKDALFWAMYHDRNGETELPDIKIIDIYVCKLRKVLKGSDWKIETVWGEGYRLVEAGT